MSIPYERVELVSLADELNKALDQMPGLNPNALLVRIYQTIRRLAAQDHEPVAWQYRDFQWSDERWHVCAERPNDIKGRTIRPLYAEPPPAAAQHFDYAIKEALEAFVKAYGSQDSHTKGLDDAVAMARAALLTKP